MAGGGKGGTGLATGLSYPAPCPKMARGHTAATPSLLLWLMLPPPPPLSSFPLIFVLSPSCFSSLYYFFPISDFVSLLRSPPPPSGAELYLRRATARASLWRDPRPGPSRSKRPLGVPSHEFDLRAFPLIDGANSCPMFPRC